MSGLRIITSFNLSMYNASGKAMLASLRKYMPTTPVTVYLESKVIGEKLGDASLWRGNYSGLNRFNVSTVDLLNLPEFERLHAAFADRIPVEQGGAAVDDIIFGEPEDKDRLWRFNWFRWCRKVVAQQHAIINRPHVPNYLLWLDCDTRFTRALLPTTVHEHMQRPIGVCNGDRKAPETGAIAYDLNKCQTVNFIEEAYRTYASGDIFKEPRWDDCWVYRMVWRKLPDLVQDYVAGMKSIKHTNSNGHTTGGQVIPISWWGHYIEHDKGVHVRKFDLRRS